LVVAPPILLYDGVCGLCNRLVQFILRRDAKATFRFASLQSGLAARVLARHGILPQALDTVYVVIDFELSDERLLSRSDAVVFILGQLGADELRSARPGQRPGPTQATLSLWTMVWRLAGALLPFVPRIIREWGYRLVACNRYRVFGRYDACLMPSEETRSRFLDL
jgi:predicted DCC family thiol-disulfide oxidoreductase YuxK